MSTGNDGDDLVALARRARGALTDGHDATLLIAGVGRFGGDDDSEVLLQEHSGRPTFVCLPGSPLAASAGQSALLTVSAANGGPKRMTVILAGRLCLIEDEPLPLPDVVLVALPVEQVVIECDDPATTALTQQVIPLGLYWQAEPDPLARSADVITRHTNASHQLQLRAYAARRGGVCIDDVAGVSLRDLDRFGARVVWVDVDGAHDVSIGFPMPADSPMMLGDLLRQELDATC